MLKTSRSRPQFSLAGILLSVFFLCATIAILRLAFHFLEADAKSLAVGGVAASVTVIGAMIGSLATGRGSASRGAITGAVFGLLLLISFMWIFGLSVLIVFMSIIG